MIHALIVEIQLRSAEKLDTAPGRDSSETNLGRMAKLFIHSLSIYLPPLICFFEEGDTVHLWQPTHEDKYLATNCVNIESTLIIYTRGLLIQINMEPGMLQKNCESRNNQQQLLYTIHQKMVHLQESNTMLLNTCQLYVSYLYWRHNL